MPTYTYTSSKDFINNLAFEYIETYSFQRGEAFEEQEKKNKEIFEKLSRRKDEQNYLTIEEEQQLYEIGSTQYLINKKGDFHWSGNKINSFQNTDPVVDSIKNILLIEAIDIPQWLCAPVYRDAIVFYNNKNEVVSCLNVCLGCQYMETKMFDHINGDTKTYDLLSALFIEIGHQVEPKGS